MSSLTENRLKLLAQGYRVHPTRTKVPGLKGWNSVAFVKREMTEARIAKWPALYPKLPSTGVHMYDRLGALDNDCDNEVLADLFWAAVDRHAPEVGERAPRRYGRSQFKVALFVRYEPDAASDSNNAKLSSHKYTHPDELKAWEDAGSEEGKRPGHRVEVFTGKTVDDEATHQMVVDGPHSYDDAGKAINYVWSEGPTLFDTPLQALPVLTEAQALAIINDFDRAAQAAGFIMEVKTSAAEGSEVFSITEETRFAVQDAGLLPYSELHEDMRCTSSFIPGDSGDNPSKCWVRWSDRHGCLAVYNHGTGVWYLPAEKAPVDTEALGEALREVAAEHGITIAREPLWREVTKTGAPRASLHNARLAIEALGVHCSEDTFHHRLYVGRSPAASPSEPLPSFAGAVTDAAIGSLRVLLSDTYGIDFTEKHVRDAVNTLAHENRFDPVLDMLTEAEASWDGVKRLDQMAHKHFGCADTELNRQCVRKTMIAAVARARVPGVKFDTIPVLEGPEGWNKSSAWAVLAGEGNFSDASILGHNGREVQEQLADVWIHENAELAGMKKAEVEVVKAFASRQEDRARPAYGHYLVAQPRRSIEVGTTNSRAYLHSPTGNRRFWPLRMERRIDLDKLRRERLQLWGEAAAAQAAGEGLTLSEDLWAAAGAEQEERRVRHPWEAILETMCEASGPLAGATGTGVIVITRVGDEQRVHTADIFRHVLRMPEGQLNRGHAMTVQEIMLMGGWVHHTNIRIEGRQGAGYTKTVT